MKDAPGKFIFRVSGILFIVLGVLFLVTALTIMAGDVFRELSATVEGFWDNFRLTGLSHLRETLAWLRGEHGLTVASGSQAFLLGIADFLLSTPVLRDILPANPLNLPMLFGWMTLVLAVWSVFLGITGLVNANSMGKKGWRLLSFALVSIALHIALLILLFRNGALAWALIFVYIVIPILYFIGAAQNTGNRKLAKNTIAYSFILPNLLGFGIFVLIPMVFALGLSFMEWHLATNTFTFIGLDNFRRMSSDPLFWPSLRNTIYFTALSMPITLVFALLLAVLLNNRWLRGRSFFRSVMFFPHVASLIAMAAVWNQVFHPSWGPVNQLLMSLGVDSPPRWAADNSWVIPTIAFFGVWRNMGYFMVIYLAGLQGIPAELYEAAEMDGASKRQRFTYITLPQLRHVTFFVAVMLTITNFRVFDQVLMITNSTDVNMPGSSSTMLVVHIYRSAFINWNMGYASALGFVLFLLVFSVTIAMFLYNRRYRDE
ncbi:MAG: sugar ABC transporter permease [Defluviitaleaceae bacterium]|nr:sugar ABC transporter permease [Defluviitaleaceae bacterium]MCL2837118.1 sugar ABC transporter permease [Defluviitaleaceae bacterium]